MIFNKLYKVIFNNKFRKHKITNNNNSNNKMLTKCGNVQTNHVSLIEISQTNHNVSNVRPQKVMPKISKCNQKRIWGGNVSPVPSLVISPPKPNVSNVKYQKVQPKIMNYLHINKIIKIYK